MGEPSAHPDRPDFWIVLLWHWVITRKYPDGSGDLIVGGVAMGCRISPGPWVVPHEWGGAAPSAPTVLRRVTAGRATTVRREY
jgi:hypothetical protein